LPKTKRALKGCKPVQSPAAWVLDQKNSGQPWGSVDVHTSTHQHERRSDMGYGKGKKKPGKK
jgi:hypothetical protein